MPITIYLDGYKPDPETKRVMSIAFEMARVALRLEIETVVFCEARNMPDTPAESTSARYRRPRARMLGDQHTPFSAGERRTVLLQMAQVWQRLRKSRRATRRLIPPKGCGCRQTGLRGLGL